MIYLLLPAFNEEHSILKLFAKLSDYVRSKGVDLTAVLLDDGSADRTAALAEEHGHGMKVVVLKHALNRGLGETARDLFEYAAAHTKDDDVIVRMDCDDTHDPESIGTMAGIIARDEADVVIASRFRRGGGMSGLNAYRSAVSFGASLFMKLVFPIAGVRDYSCGFRAYRASLIRDAIRLYGNNFIQLKGLGFTGTLEKLIKLNLMGARFAEVGHYLHYDRKVSYSKMVTSITALGYLALVLLYYWPFGGWLSQYRGLAKSYQGDRRLYERLVRKRLGRYRTRQTA